jgi:hypothetical protein
MWKPAGETGHKTETHRVEKLDGKVDSLGIPGNRDKSLFRVGRLPGNGRSAGVGHSNLTLRLGSDLVDFRSTFANDCWSV